MPTETRRPALNRSVSFDAETVEIVQRIQAERGGSAVVTFGTIVRELIRKGYDALLKEQQSNAA